MISGVSGDSAGQAPARRHGGRGPFIESLLLATVALAVLNFHPFGSAHLRRHFRAVMGMTPEVFRRVHGVWM